MAELCDQMRYIWHLGQDNHKDPRFYKLDADLIPANIKQYCEFHNIDSKGENVYT